MYIVGLDLGKRNSQVCVGHQDGTVVVEQRLTTTCEALTKVVGKYLPATVLVEASTSAEWVARHLERVVGAKVIVADPRFGPMYARADKSIKTDRRDARALFEAARLGAHRPAYRKTDEHRLLRQQLLVRISLVRARAKFVTQIRALLEIHGVIVKSCAVEHFVERMEEIVLDEALGKLVLPLVAQVGSLHEEIDALDSLVEEAAKKNELARRFDAVVGIGPITAIAAVVCLGDASRFSSAREVASYVGLVPSENSSGERHRRGAITKSGDAMARSYLIEAAWRILRSKRDEVAPLREWANAVAERRGKPRAVTALARRLVCILYAMARDGTTFDSTRLVRH